MRTSNTIQTIRTMTPPMMMARLSHECRGLVVIS